MDYMEKGKRADSSKRAYLRFLKNWAQAGAPQNFRFNGRERIWDLPSMRENLEMKSEGAERRILRLKRAKLHLQEKANSL